MGAIFIKMRLNKISFEKLVLLDVFSYSCMNCLRSLKLIRRISNRYGKHGLETIIVHPPEWEFEKKDGNILSFLKAKNIKFPIILDKDRRITKKLGVDFWPTQILLKNGKIVYKHIGEGNYKKLENEIVKILDIKSSLVFRYEPKYATFDTLYLGKRKNGNVKGLTKNLKFGIAYKEGIWKQNNEFLQSVKKCSMTILAKGKYVNMVAESLAKKPINVGIKLNGKFTKNIKISKPRLYNLIKLKNKKMAGLTIMPQPNLAVYSFSFQ